jgi:membrane protease YdiL (CAAX protease family)
MNFHFIKQALFICLYFIIFIVFRDILYVFLIRFFDQWLSSFVILPLITLVALLIIKFYTNKFDFLNFKVREINLNFLFQVLFLCLCLYFYCQLVYVLLEKYELFYPKQSSTKLYLISFFAVILASVFEEFFFRGHLLQYAINIKVENTLAKKVFFSVLTSFLFSIAHMRFDLFIFQYFFFSLICSLIFIKSINIFYPIFFHFCYNMMVVTDIGEIFHLKELNILHIIFMLMLFFILIIRQMLKLKYAKPL